ncbi:DUF554 domain-containing protein [Geitlerinema sp. PCC 9228]|jgi:hypothetical protein|uniref:DUF554 domain-containing protein n=1 Tax=Geitlerinema sp. PCC 9228 TaxID=111611 RepID=UPI0008F9D92A|nr:DUF554 domain-containing protein [Geitlerinema sp. PCC 9228]
MLAIGEFWAKTSGTWMNIATVAVGTGLGLLVRQRLSMSMQKIITQGIGLTTLPIGLTMADDLTKVEVGPINGVVLGLLAMVVGGILGEWWEIEERLAAMGNWLKVRFRGQGKFAEGFVAASLIFCVGPLALIGSLKNGLEGDDTLLTVKATLDGITSVALTSSYGIGVGFSILTILLYQGGVSLVAGVFADTLVDPNNNPYVLMVTGVGGLSILAIGINLLDLGKIRVASFLPSLLLAPIFLALSARWFS